IHEHVFVYHSYMSSAGRLHALLNELAAEDVSIGSLRDELLELDRARARLDAEVSRRLRAFDRSCEWSVDGSQSAVAFLTTHTRCARADAHHRVRVARQLEAVEATAVAWAAGEITTRHVEAVARARHAAKADDAFAEFAPALTEVARAGTPEDVARTARQWRGGVGGGVGRGGARGGGGGCWRRGRVLSRPHGRGGC